MIPVTGFSDDLLRLNRLDGAFAGWLFLAGMGYGETDAWWKEGQRQQPHEGIDLLFYSDPQGMRRQLPPDAAVPAGWDGLLVACFDDFLGSTVVVRHGISDADGWLLHSLYGHIRPVVQPGQLVTAGQTIATVAAARPNRTPTTPPAHLHLSLAWFHSELPLANLAWPTLPGHHMVRLVDPLPLLAGSPWQAAVPDGTAISTSTAPIQPG
ncbi:MAG: M23 family metallopeptidase [Thermodesulfobacteriota bacterium]